MKPGFIRKVWRRIWPILFFLLGFAYVAWRLPPIGSALTIAKQSVYLVIAAVLLGYELRAFAGLWSPRTPRMQKLWRYQAEAVHFLLGGLLSECTLFFFKSASVWTSFAFLGLLALLLVANEFTRLKEASGVAMRSGLFALALAAFFAYVVPIGLGHVGPSTFLISLAATALTALLLVLRVGRRLGDRASLAYRQMGLPILSVVAVFATLYFTRLIPPVPLSVRYLGIFHELRKENGHYVLGVDPLARTPWQNGEEVFRARPGERPYCFARVFAPDGFSDRLHMRWMYREPRAGGGHWETADVIDMPISGGRREGFRGFTVKSNFQPGEWQVRVETSDEREVGRVYFTIEADQPDPDGQPRPLIFEEH